MTNIVPEIIAPIKLPKGSHRDTGSTGQGCFMNVVAYLNGEPQITDQSPCVCRMVRPLAIQLNDQGNDEQRQRLLPFVMRAMGSATADPAVIESRRVRIRAYGAECQQIINDWRAMKNAYASANAYAYAYAYANAYAYAYASANAYAKRDELLAKLFDAGLHYLDDVLPKLDRIDGIIAERAARLCELQGV